MRDVKWVQNAAGRMVPEAVNGKTVEPFRGVGKYRPSGRKYGPPIATCADYPADGNKLQPDLKSALIKAGLKDGMTISTHHHFRNGDLIANQVFEIAAQLGLKDLVWDRCAVGPQRFGLGAVSFVSLP